MPGPVAAHRLCHLRFCAFLLFEQFSQSLQNTTHLRATLGCVLFSSTLFFQLCPFFGLNLLALQLNSYVLLARIIVIFLSTQHVFFLLLRSYNFLIVPAMRSLMFPYLSLVFLLQPYRLSKRNAQRTKQKIYLRCSFLFYFFVARLVCSLNVVCSLLVVSCTCIVIGVYLSCSHACSSQPWMLARWMLCARNVFKLMYKKILFEGVRIVFFSPGQYSIILYSYIEYLYIFMFIIQNTQLWTPDIQPLSKKIIFCLLTKIASFFFHRFVSFLFISIRHLVCCRCW